MAVDGEVEDDFEVEVLEAVGVVSDEGAVGVEERADAGNIYISSVNTFVTLVICERFWKKPLIMIGCM